MEALRRDEMTLSIDEQTALDSCRCWETIFIFGRCNLAARGIQRVALETNIINSYASHQRARWIEVPISDKEAQGAVASRSMPVGISFGQSGDPQSLRVSRQIFNTSIRAKHVFEIRNTQGGI